VAEWQEAWFVLVLQIGHLGRGSTRARRVVRARDLGDVANRKDALGRRFEQRAHLAGVDKEDIAPAVLEAFAP